MILAYDPAAISIPSFGVHDIWSLLFKFAWVVRFCDVIMTSSSTTKSVSFITWFLWCLFRVTFWIKQAFTKQWSEHSVFRITWHKSVTWLKLSHGFVTWHNEVTWYSDLFYSEMFKSDEIHLYFSLYMWGSQVEVQHFCNNCTKCCKQIWDPFTFVRVSFVQKQYDPQLTID